MVAALSFAFVIFLLAVERYGLIAVLCPCSMRAGRVALERPLFDLMRGLVLEVQHMSSNLLRMIMLISMQLDEAQRKELLEGLDISWRQAVFSKPASAFLWWPVRRLLLGRPVKAVEVKEVLGECEIPITRKMSWQQRDRSNSMMELVRSLGTQGSSPSPGKGSSSAIFTAEKIVAEKMIDAAYGTAQQAVADTAQSCREKVARAGTSIAKMVKDPKMQVTGAAGVSGAVVLGTAAGTTGLLCGSLLGAACGVVPAFFTFGLSIPLGAVVGGGMGLTAGTVCGGTTGFLTAGMAAYCVCNKHARDGCTAAVRAHES
eukprot:TRINITY_DN61250_c0_g1_i1.p1 TRINITY_DN61250_c0_g1~~TRINITY_DN61250_c0_g1_i1.p1  ORF type:complete len:356 (-),score=64.38 TRINITY_DN61250_c0_g1_i1:444-1391(-)